MRETGEILDQAKKISNIGSWSFNLKSGEVIWSDALYSIFGVGPKNGAPSWPKGHKQFYHPDDWEWSSKKIIESIGNGETYDFVNRIIRPDGSIHYTRVMGKPFFGHDGKVEKYVGTVQDITERKKAEEEIRSLAQFPFENPNPVLRVNKDGTLLFSNKAAEMLISEQKLADKQHIVELFQQSVLGSLHSGLHKEVEFKLEDKIFSVEFAPVVESGYVNVYGRDVTGHKEAEEERNKLLNAYEERIKELRLLYAISKIGEDSTALLDEILRETNRFIPLAWQYPDVTCSRIIFENQEFKTENFRETQWKQHADIKLNGKKVGVVEVYYLEEKPTCDEGPFLKEERNLIDAVAESLGRIVGNKKAEETLSVAFADLALVNEKLGVVGKLTRHDVRNKLSAVTGNIYLAKQALPADCEVVKFLNETESSVDQIERIFDFARTYEQLGVEKLSSIDVGKSFVDAVALLPDLGKIEVVNECKGLSVLADSLLGTLFYNLIDNTIRYGEKVNQIRIYHKIGEDGLKLIYEDDRIGIPENEKEIIFKEGYGKNTGLGLHMIKKMCNIYGWTIQETGTPGKGAQFTMTIPKTSKNEKTAYQLQ